MKKQKKKEDLERPSISLDQDLYALALQRMAQRRVKMFSRYVQDLIKEDTTTLLQPVFLKADETTDAGPELSQDKAKGKYQTATQKRAERGAGAKMAKLSENLGSGSSTPTKKRSRPAG